MIFNPRPEHEKITVLYNVNTGMKALSKGTEANGLEILVSGVDLTPFARMHNGVVEDGIILKFGRYKLEDVLNQMLDDYGQEELIQRIKALE